MLSKLPLCCLLLYCLVFSVKGADSSRKNASGTISFLTKSQAAKAIVNDSQESYFAKLKGKEILAKTKLNTKGESEQQRLAILKKYYEENVSEYSVEEKKFITRYVKKLEPCLRDYPKFAGLSWSFLKVTQKIESGLPHTRDKHIVFSQKLISQMLTAEKRGLAEDGMMERFGVLLIHEQMHVFQRKYKNNFDGFYQSRDFIKTSKIVKGHGIQSHEVHNPDAVETDWVLLEKAGDAGKNARYILPILLLPEKSPIKSLYQMGMYGVIVQGDPAKELKPVFKNGKLEKSILNSIKRYRDAFPLTSYNFHPHEAGADLFSKLVVADKFKKVRPFARYNKKLVATETAVLRKWFKKIMAEEHIK